MKITRAKTWVEKFALTKPYAIAYSSLDSVEIVFVYVEAEGGRFGLGSGSPAEVITGESVTACRDALEQHIDSLVLGRNLHRIHAFSARIRDAMPGTPAARSALETALYDLFCKTLDLSLVDFLGQVHERLPTSITIGIQSLEGTLQEAEDRMGEGFRIIKLKTGQNLEQDIEMVTRLRERVGSDISIRVDANQGYSLGELQTFIKASRNLDLEFIEQPLPVAETDEMRKLDLSIRKSCMADESLQVPEDTIPLLQEPRPFGLFNIKLMKCGGIQAALDIARTASLANVPVMWGCMDESRISISAALHVALACNATRHLDLDGSFDLARHVASGGFRLRDGFLSVLPGPGLGITRVELPF